MLIKKQICHSIHNFKYIISFYFKKINDQISILHMYVKCFIYLRYFNYKVHDEKNINFLKIFYISKCLNIFESICYILKVIVLYLPKFVSPNKSYIQNSREYCIGR